MGTAQNIFCGVVPRDVHIQAHYCRVRGLRPGLKRELGVVRDKGGSDRGSITVVAILDCLSVQND